MVPKNVAVARAGAPPSRDLSWIDRMYMKFETMCVEVDKNPSMLLQETSKFVESQVNAVGSNVKKLCTELIQDLLSPEGGKKKLECALHCKCHCMDSEKPQPIEGAKGAAIKEESVDNGDVTFNDIINKEKDTMKKEERNLEISDVLKTEATVVETDEPKVMAATEQLKREDVECHKDCEGKLGLVQGRENCTTQAEEVEANCKRNGTRTHAMPIEGSMKAIMEASVFRSEAVFAELGSTPKANNESGAIDIDDAATRPLGSQKLAHSLEKQDDKGHELLGELQARDIEICCVLPASNGCSQKVLNGEVGPYLSVYDGHANYKHGLTFCSEGLHAEEMKDTNQGDGGLEFVDDDDFKACRLLTEEPMYMSEFLTEDDAYDEEQSAHWFVGEDFTKALQTDIFSPEKSRYGDSFVNEFDLDWELL